MAVTEAAAVVGRGGGGGGGFGGAAIFARVSRGLLLRGVCNTGRRRLRPLSADEVVDVVEPDRADQDEVDRDNIVQQPRHQQNQYPASEGSKRQEMGDGPHHCGSSLRL